MSTNSFVYVTAIAAPREKVWEALTVAEFTCQYWHGTLVESTWEVGEPVVFWVSEDSGERVGARGVIEVVEPPARLRYSWSFPSNPELAKEPPSRVTFELEDLEGNTRLTVIHDHFPDESGVKPLVTAGWPLVLSGLKTLAETGSTTDFSSLPSAA